MYYRVAIGSTTPELVLTIEPSDSRDRHLNLLAGTDLRTDIDTGWAQGNDVNHLCATDNSSISKDNKCFDIDDRLGIFSYTATDATTRSKVEQGYYYEEKSLYKPYDDPGKYRLFDGYRIIVSPDAQQLAFVMWDKTHTDYYLHILNVDGTGDHTIPVVDDGINGYGPVAWLD